MRATSIRSGSLLRWQINKDEFCFISYGGLLGDGPSALYTRAGDLNCVSLSSVEEANRHRKDADFFPKLYQKYDKSISNGPFLSPVGRETLFRSQIAELGVYFDFWCRGNKLVEVYVNSVHDIKIGGGEFIEKPPAAVKRLFRSDFHPERERRPDQDPTIQWDTVGEWTYDWTGPFYVAAVGDERYFLSEAGRVYLAPRGAKAGTPLKEVWKDTPVDALIHDADNGKWYAFTKDQYFEIADPIKPKAHTIPIRRTAKADEALATAVKCGRVIRGLPEPKGK